MKYSRIYLSQATPGMVLAENIYTLDNHIVITKGTTLTDKIINKLKFYIIDSFSIYTNSEFVNSESQIAIATLYESVNSSESYQRFSQAYKNNVNEFKRSFQDLLPEQCEINADLLVKEIHAILFDCDSNIELFKILHSVRRFDYTTYVHSLNVAIICNIIGKWLEFNEKDMEVITLCGLLHDIGKLMISSKIIAKPDRLTEEEFTTVQTHTNYGYDILKDKRIDLRIKNSALMHHERCDGSGYPFGLRSDQIDPFAKLVAIADVFDAMTSSRVYRDPLCPFEVINMFESEGCKKYDPKFIFTFLENIVETYIHNNVTLNNGVKGEIILINKRELSRPIIKTGSEFIDLAKYPNLHIQSVS